MIALNPNQTFEFTLDSENGMPRSDRTVFVSRFLSSGALAEVDQLTNQAAEVLGTDEETELLLKALALGAVVLKPATRPDGDHLLILLDIEADKIPEQVTRFTFTVLNGDQLDRVRKALAETEHASPIAALPVLTEAFGVAQIRAQVKVSDLTISEIRELLGKACQTSRLARASHLKDLAASDLWDLLTRVLRLSRLTEEERKKSALQSASAAAARSAGIVRRSA